VLEGPPRLPWGRHPVPRDPPGPSRWWIISPWAPPRAPPRPTLALPRLPETAQGRARSAQGPHQVHKVNMLKTLEIHTFALPGSQKNALGEVFDAPRLPLRPSRVSALIVRVAPGCPDGRLGSPRDPSRTPKDRPGSPQGPPRRRSEEGERRDARADTFVVVDSIPEAPPGCPRDPSGALRRHQIVDISLIFLDPGGGKRKSLMFPLALAGGNVNGLCFP